MACNRGSMVADPIAPSASAAVPGAPTMAPACGCDDSPKARTPWWVWVGLALLLIIWLDVRK